ncbi:MAG: glycosyltransferase, partial [Chitinophagaceae bacterium]
MAGHLTNFKFIFFTFHSLETLGCNPTGNHIKARKILSFYSGKRAYHHTQWIEQNIKNLTARKILKKVVERVELLNKLFTVAQAILFVSFKKIDIVQANCGFHPLPYNLARFKKTTLVYYFRDLQDYTRINISKFTCAAHYFFVSNTLMQSYMKQLGLPPQKCSMVHSPFDVQQRLKLEKHPDLKLVNQLKQEGKKIIILAARICEDKGQHIALAAINIVKKQYTNFCLLIVGKPDRDPVSHAYNESLHQFIREHGLEENVLFLGHRRDILHLIQQANISVQTATYFEALSGALVESLQLGVTTVASAVGGSPEIIKNNVTGYTYDPNSHEELAKILI